jgi:hypothetical protein
MSECSLITPLITFTALTLAINVIHLSITLASWCTAEKHSMLNVSDSSHEEDNNFSEDADSSCTSDEENHEKREVVHKILPFISANFCDDSLETDRTAARNTNFSNKFSQEKYENLLKKFPDLFWVACTALDNLEHQKKQDLNHDSDLQSGIDSLD